jgi:glutathione synthase/RimK-type ligase-like ATP-grasp enzyme
VHNVAQGARCVPQSLADATGRQLAELAQAAARALELDYAGIDLLPTRDGVQVIEVNGVAAWHGLQRVAPIDIAGAIVADLLDRKLAASRARRHA